MSSFDRIVYAPNEARRVVLENSIVDEAVSYEPFVLFMVPIRAPDGLKGCVGSKVTETLST